MSVCCERCVLSGRVLCNGPIPRPGESYRLLFVSVCDTETSRMRRGEPGPRWAVAPEKENLFQISASSLLCYRLAFTFIGVSDLQNKLLKSRHLRLIIILKHTLL
jgi:hypothetical protein